MGRRKSFNPIPQGRFFVSDESKNDLALWHRVKRFAINSPKSFVTLE